MVTITASLVLLAGGIFVARSYFTFLSPTPPDTTDTADNKKTTLTKPLSFDQVKSSATARFKITFPNIKSETVITELSNQLQIFIPESVKNPALKEVVYENDKRGYWAEFSRPETLLDFRTGFLTSLRMAGWSIVAGSTSELFSFFEMENEKYTVRITEALEMDIRSMEIQVIEN